MTVSRIDCHMHFIPELYRTVLDEHSVDSSRLPTWSPELLLEFMDDHDIGVAVVSLPPPGPYVGDQDETRKLSRACNEYLADLILRHPDRLVGLASLPLPYVDDALAELKYALDVLELDGLMLLSNVAGTYLGAETLDPLFAEMDQRRCYGLIHPNIPAVDLTPEFPVWLYDYPFDTTRAVVGLIHSGTLRRYQKVILQLAHMGGTAPFLAHRLELLPVLDSDAAEDPVSVIEYLGRFYYDTALAANEVTFDAVTHTVSADQVVFGSDWPYVARTDSADPAPGLQFLDSAVRTRVEATNATKLLAGRTRERLRRNRRKESGLPRRPGR